MDSNYDLKRKALIALRDNYYEAKCIYKQLIQMGELDCYNNLGCAYSKMGQSDKAQKYWQLGIENKCISSAYNILHILVRNKEYQSAFQLLIDFQDSLEILYQYDRDNEKDLIREVYYNYPKLNIKMLLSKLPDRFFEHTHVRETDIPIVIEWLKNNFKILGSTKLTSYINFLGGPKSLICYLLARS